MNARARGGRLNPSERALGVEAGQVACPRQGIVDIERCWVCPEYRGLSAGHVEALICGLSAESLASAVWSLDHGPRPERG